MILSQGPTSPSRPNHEFDGLVRSAGFGYLRTPYKSGGFVLIILYSLYLEYDSPLLPSASGLAG
jgi:hypothetical protein